MPIGTWVRDSIEALDKMLLADGAKREDYMLGDGGHCIHVYAKCFRGRWRLMTPDSVNSVEIIWHWGVGPIVALTE